MVSLLFDHLYKTNLSDHQIYQSRWSLSKSLYLACRFSLLLGWPIVMYAFLFDHDMESCKPLLVIVTVLIMLFVRPALSLLFTANFTDSTLYITKLAMLSSMFIYPPRICNHRRKALVIAHLSTLPFCLPLRRLLVFSERIDTLEGCLFNIRQNRVLQGFPSWI